MTGLRLDFILVLSLLFTEHHFSLPSHAGNAFLIRFIFYQWLFRVVTRKKVQWDESTFVPISCSIFRRHGYLAGKIASANMTMFTKPETYENLTKPNVFACVSEVFGPRIRINLKKLTKCVEKWTARKEPCKFLVFSLFLLSFSRLFRRVKVKFSS